MNINKNVPKSMVIGITLSIMMLAGIMWYKIYSISPDKQMPQETQSSVKVSTNDEVITEQQRQANFQASEDEKEYKEMQASLTDSYSFFYLVHEMANTKITAVDGKIRGTKAITLPRVLATLEFMRNNGDYLRTAMGAENYSIVYKGISEWQMKDYSSAARIHNIVLEKLNGEDQKIIKD